MYFLVSLRAFKYNIFSPVFFYVYSYSVGNAYYSTEVFNFRKSTYAQQETQVCVNVYQAVLKEMAEYL